MRKLDGEFDLAFESEEGAAMAEYGLLVVGIALVMLAAVVIFGAAVAAKFETFPGLFG